MKNLLAILISLIMVFSLTACGGNNENPIGGTDTDAETVQPSGGKVISPEDPDAPEDPDTSETTAPVPLQLLIGSHFDAEYDREDAFTTLCSAEWNSLLLDEGSAATFPALAQNLREMTEFDFEYNAGILAEMLPYAREAAEQEFFGGFTSNSSYFVQRADDRILSIRVDENQYTGGAHPNYGVIGWNLDPSTGEALDLSDVLTGLESLPSILTEKITEKYTYEPFSGLQEDLEGRDEGSYQWTMDYQGITFYFSPYDIASYAAGLLTATIWFDEMPELFVEKYTQVPENGWAKLLPIGSEIEADLDSRDRGRDKLRLFSYEDEYGSLDLYVARNDEPEQHLEECYGYTMKPLLVCLGNPGSERYYIYVEATAENDYTSIYIYDLNGEKITLNGEISGTGFPGVLDESWGEYGAWYEEVLNDPSEFVLDSRVQCLGTWTGQRTYRADPQSGTLQPQTDYYTLSEPIAPIVSAIDLEVTMLPGEEKEVLPAGTRFYFRRYIPQTEELTYAELELEDGRECRIEITYQDWEPLINGVCEWDCFVDLMYAG